MKNIIDYISRTVAFKTEYDKLEKTRSQNEDYDALEEIKKKQFSAMVAFNTFEDLIACRAILNIMYPEDRKVSKFIDNMINDINILAPQKMTDMVDTYMQTVLLIVKEVKRREKLYNEFAEKRGLIRFDEFVKNGREIIQKGSEHSQNSNIVSGNQIDPNRANQQIISQTNEEGKGVATISKPSPEELRRAAEENAILDRQKLVQDEKTKQVEEEKIARYEADLARKRLASEVKALQQIEELQKRKN